MIGKSKYVSLYEEFTIKGKKYKIVSAGFKGKDYWIIQSLYDNGKRFNKFKDELDETLYQHRSENISVFGKKIANS